MLAKKKFAIQNLQSVIVNRKSSIVLLLAPAVVLVGGFFVVPLGWLVRVSLYDRPASNSQGGSRFYDPDSFTFKQYQELLSDPFYLRLLGGTLAQAALITVAVMTLAYPCAVMIHQFGPRLKSGALLLVMLPKLTNLLVLTYGLLVLLSNAGVINQVLLGLGIIQQPIKMVANTFAVVVTEVVIIGPYPILILVSLFERVDPSLAQAARGMGAGPWRAFYHTYFKLTLPGAIAAAFITFVWGVGAYLGPVTLGSPDNYTTSVQVFTEMYDYNQWPLASALAVSNLLLLAGLLLVYALLSRLIFRKDEG
jgi:ABC-type spermidine/putrescine transport system permease subunit I